MLYLEGTDVIGHLFAADVPPRMGCVAGRGVRAVQRHRRRVLRAGRPADRPVDAAGRGGWRDAHRQLRPRLQVGRRPLLRARVAATRRRRRSGTGSTASSPLGRAREEEPRARAAPASTTSSRRSRRCSVFPSIARRGRLRSARRSATSPAPARKDLVAEVPVRRLAAEQMSEKEASEYAKKLMALGYLSGSEPGKLAPRAASEPGMTEGAWNNLGLYLFALGGEAEPGRGATPPIAKAIALRPGLRVPEAQPRGAPAGPRRGPAGDRRALPGHRRGHENPERDAARLGARLRREGASRSRSARSSSAASALYPDSEAIHRALALLDFKQKDCRQADATLSPFEAPTQEPQTLERARARPGLPRAQGGRDRPLPPFARARAGPADRRPVARSCCRAARRRRQ